MYSYETKTPMASTYSKFNLFCRSILFTILSVTTMILYSFIVAFSILFPLKYRQQLIRYYLRFYMWLLEKICLITYQVKGLENIPKDRTGVVLCKHQSTWETFFFPLAFHNFAVIAKRELLWLPFFGWGLAASDPIAINRSNTSSAMQQIITKGRKCLEAGRWIVIFPEGTRIPYGKVGNYRLGGPRLAAATGYPIIPIAHNAGKFWGKRKFIKQPGVVQVVIGPAIESAGRTPEELLELTKNWIESTVAQIDGFVDESSR